MQMSLVQMGGNGAFKAVCQKSAGKLAADLMHLLRRSLTGGKALDNVVGQNTAIIHGLIQAFLGAVHSTASISRSTIETCYI